MSLTMPPGSATCYWEEVTHRALSCWHCTSAAAPALAAQLLADLLLDGHHVVLMMRYVSDVKNLMQMMNLLKDSSRSIQYEAFHVFKVSVASDLKDHLQSLDLQCMFNQETGTCQVHSAQAHCDRTPWFNVIMPNRLTSTCLQQKQQAMSKSTQS